MIRSSIVLLSTALLTTAAAGGEGQPRRLFIAVDAVPFATMEELRQDPEGDPFHWLLGPVPLISTFPSITSLAIAAILGPLGVAQSPGYEAKHYDWERNRINGGGVLSYRPFPWREFFDWRVEGLLRKGTSAARPLKAARKDITQSLEAFVGSEKQSFFIYYDTTDSAGHLKSPEGLKPILRQLAEELAELRHSHPEMPFQTVIFSDHGMAGGEILKNVRRAAFRTLKQAGFRRKKRIKKDHHVIFVPFGLVSSFVVFTVEGQERAVASALVTTEGVDLCVLGNGAGWTVKGKGGSADFERRDNPSSQWKYTTTGADPLRLLERLEVESSVEGWVSDAIVLAATHDAEYPDPLHRISRSFDLVANPASVICSVARDAVFGSKMTSLASRLSGSRLRWTHGALHSEASLGFLMSDVDGWRPDGPVRFDDALRPFLEGVPTLPAAR